MSTDDTLCFADHDVVTGAPTVDGFTGIEDDGVITPESDAGYVLGSRLTFGNGSLFPPVIFQGVKNGNYLNLAFFCRFDMSFDQEDVVVIAMRPKVSDPTQTTARRIDIFPVWEAAGADEKNTGTGGPAGDPDNPPPGVLASYAIRTNHLPQNVIHYRGRAAGDPWTTTNPDSTTYNPTNILVKTRSWQPPVMTPATSGATAQTLPTSTFNVDPSTASFPTAGIFTVGGQIVRYTGKTSTSFTGCTGGTGSIAAGSDVSTIPEFAWSIEVQLPLTTALGGPDWIDILDSFALYFAVIRVGKTLDSGGTPSDGWFSTQFVFPIGTNFLAGVLDETMDINASWYGTGLIPALQSPPGSNLGVGVHFVGGEAGVGVRDTMDPAGSAVGTTVHGAGSSAFTANRLVAKVENTGTAAANNVSAEFRFAIWGLPATTFPSWALASGASADQPTGVTVGTSGTTEITWTWPKALVPSAYQPPHSHQCVWVQLSSSTGVNFNQSSVRRNMDFDGLSELTRPATISGVGYERPPKGKHHFLLITHVRRIEARRFQGQQNLQARQTSTSILPPVSGKKMVYWVWIVAGYRRTGKTLRIRKREFEILDPSPGVFGSIALHRGLDDVFTYEMSGGGIQHLG